jgi:hypothetical protein
MTERILPVSPAKSENPPVPRSCTQRHTLVPLACAGFKLDGHSVGRTLLSCAVAYAGGHAGGVAVPTTARASATPVFKRTPPARWPSQSPTPPRRFQSSASLTQRRKGAGKAQPPRQQPSGIHRSPGPQGLSHRFLFAAWRLCALALNPLSGQTPDEREAKRQGQPASD